MVTVSEPGQQAIVLAAGKGTRLAPYTDELPKVLVRVGGTPLLVRMLRQLEVCGVRSVTVVTGDRAAQVEAAAREAGTRLDLSFIHSERFASTNNSYSLSLCAKNLSRGTLVVEGDVIADTSVVRGLVSGPAPCWAVRRFQPGMDGAFLRAGDDGRLVELTIVRKGLGTPVGAAFKSMGMLKLDAATGARLATMLAAEVAASGGTRYYDLVVADNVQALGLHLLSLEAGFWLEVDTPQDLAEAERGLGGRA